MEDREIELRKSRMDAMQRRRKRSLWIFLFLIACIGIVIVLFTAPIFKVSEIYFVGNVQLSNEELLSDAGIKTGKNIFSVNLSKAEKRLLDNPYICEVKASREFPNKIQIQIQEKLVAAYISCEDKLVMCDLSGKIIDIVDEPSAVESITKDLPTSLDEEEDALNATPKPDEDEDEDYDEDEEEATEAEDEEEVTETEGEEEATEAEGEEEAPEAEETPLPEEGEVAPEAPNEKRIYTLPVIYGVTVEKPSVGHKLKIKNEDMSYALIRVLNDLSNSNLLSMVTKIDISDLDDIKLWIENRLELYMGGIDEFEYKSKFSSTVIKKDISEYEKAVMDFRGDKLHVRAPGSLTLKPTPEPEEENEEDIDNESGIEPEDEPDEDFGSMTL